MAKITKRTIDAIQEQDRAFYLWDEDLKGYGLKVAPSGRKTFLIKYQLGGRQGPQRWITLGRYGQITAEHARKEAKRLLGDVAAGRDPAKDRTKVTMTLNRAMAAFFDDHVSRLKASTAAYYRDLADKYVLPFFGKRDVKDITRADVAVRHQRLKHKPYQANRALALLSKFFNWCELHGYRPDGSNPCRHVTKYKEKERKRYLSESELAQLGAALREESDPFAIAAIRLLLFTGMRRGEVLRLKWSEVDLEAGVLRLADSKTGAKVIPLAPPAIDVLKSLPELAGNPFVIAGKKPGAHLVGLKGPWRRVLARAEIAHARIHDLRHSFASVGVNSGLSLPVLGALLHHSQLQTTMGYAHLSDDPVRDAGAKIATRIANALDGGQRGEVVQLKRTS